MTHLRVETISDILALADQDAAERISRRQWGPWLLDTGTMELLYVNGGRTFYAIDLEKISTSAALADWIFQINGKSWCQLSDMGHLIAALGDICNPQATLCGCCVNGGTGRTIDAAARLRRIYGAVATQGKGGDE